MAMWALAALLFALGTVSAFTRFGSLPDETAFILFVVFTLLAGVVVLVDSFYLTDAGADMGLDIIVKLLRDKSVLMVIVGVVVYGICMYGVSHGIMEMAAAEAEIEACEGTPNTAECKDALSKCRSFNDKRLRMIRGVILGFTLIAVGIMIFGGYEAWTNYHTAKDKITGKSAGKIVEVDLTG